MDPNEPILIFKSEEEAYKDYKGLCAFCKAEFKTPDELDRHRCKN